MSEPIDFALPPWAGNRTCDCVGTGHESGCWILNPAQASHTHTLPQWPGWEKCVTCNGTGFVFDPRGAGEYPPQSPCFDECANGLLPPSHQVEAVMEILFDSGRWKTRGQGPLTSDVARKALVEAARAEMSKR